MHANLEERIPSPAADVATASGSLADLPGGRPRRLGKRMRKGMLVIHIASAGAWLGIDVVMGVMIFTALLTGDPQTAATCYQALEIFAVWPLLTVGLVCLASGVILGLGTKYGLAKYWWVATKLVLNIVLTALVLIALRPGVAQAAEYGRHLADGLSGPEPTDLLFPPIVSPTALTFALLLSVYKPWGRIRKSRGPRPNVEVPA
jgi:uncharacterized membrane protein